MNLLSNHASSVKARTNNFFRVLQHIRVIVKDQPRTCDPAYQQALSNAIDALRGVGSHTQLVHRAIEI